MILKIFFFIANIFITQPLWACSVCFKDPKSQLTVGLKNSVLVLLGFLFIIFFAFIKFIISFSRRAKVSAEKIVT